MAWRVANSLIQLRNQINILAPTRSKSSDGTIGDAAHASRNSDHNPWVTEGGIGIVTAMDITNDPAHGCDAGQLVDYLVQSRDSRIKYIIWNRRIINSAVSPWVWRQYNGQNPHNKHFHLSVKPEKIFYDNTRNWVIGHGNVNGNGTVNGNNKYRVISRNSLRLREGPGTEYDVIQNLESGQIISVLSDNGVWSQVDVEDDGLADGYVFSGYLERVE